MASRILQSNNPPAASSVQIEKLVYGGDGLARIGGRVAFVPYVLPGEEIEISAIPVKSGLLRGAPLRVVTPSPHRVTPRCEYFANCGGCHYQQIDYTFQLEQKQSILRETLSRLGNVRYDGEIQVISGQPWAYRSRIQLHFKDRAPGFRKAESHELCPITHCEISSPMINEVIGKLANAVHEPEWPAFLRTLEIFTNEREVQFHVVESTKPVAARFFAWCAGFLPNLAPGEIEYPAAGTAFRVSRGSFFQVNRFLTDALVTEVLGDYEGQHAVDLYAGVGLFSVPLARKFARVDAVERGTHAQRDLEWNAAKAGAAVTSVRAGTEEFLTGLESAPELIVADPPRAGLGPGVTDQLRRLAPSQLTIVSCDPATLARDLRSLEPVYRIQRLSLVDLFPQTYHFETVVHLGRI